MTRGLEAVILLHLIIFVCRLVDDEGLLVRVAGRSVVCQRDLTSQEVIDLSRVMLYSLHGLLSWSAT